jgi:hypothetical protein
VTFLPPKRNRQVYSCLVFNKWLYETTLAKAHPAQLSYQLDEYKSGSSTSRIASPSSSGMYGRTRYHDAEVDKPSTSSLIKTSCTRPMSHVRKTVCLFIFPDLIISDLNLYMAHLKSGIRRHASGNWCSTSMMHHAGQWPILPMEPRLQVGRLIAQERDNWQLASQQSHPPFHDSPVCSHLSSNFWM